MFIPRDLVPLLTVIDDLARRIDGQAMDAIKPEDAVKWEQAKAAGTPRHLPAPLTAPIKSIFSSGRGGPIHNFRKAEPALATIAEPMATDPAYAPFWPTPEGQAIEARLKSAHEDWQAIEVRREAARAAVRLKVGTCLASDDFRARYLDANGSLRTWPPDPWRTEAGERALTSGLMKEPMSTWPEERAVLLGRSDAAKFLASETEAEPGAASGAGDAVSPPATIPVSDRSGAGGRPTTMHLILNEHHGRTTTGAVERRLSREAAFLHAWAKDEYPGYPTPKPGTIENGIRAQHNNWLSRNPLGPHNLPTKPR